MIRLNLVAFAGASNWPLWAGQQRGLFADQGIELVHNLTTSSRQMARELQAATTQIALTSIDNVIAYVEGQGEEPLANPVDFFAFMGVDDGLLSLMSQPSIKTIADLRGQTLAVDALTTGFAFVLKEILAREEIGDQDVKYMAVGTGAERLAALKAGSCGATLLNAPLCFAAENIGKTRLARAKDVLGSYQGVVGVAQRAWARDHVEVLVSFIRAFYLSLRWLSDSQNRDNACAILAEHLPSVGNAADLAYDILIAKGGLTRSLEIDRKGVAGVIELRNRYSNQSVAVSDPDRYIDDIFRRAALWQCHAS